MKPNPNVGALVVKEGVVVGRGWHKLAGASHAEAAALEEAGAQAEGATLYVTLEPCNHHGRTPPCSEAILAAKIARVVYAAEDRNPAVVGGGAARLREAGIEVVGGVAKASVEQLMSPWNTWIASGAPIEKAIAVPAALLQAAGALKLEVATAWLRKNIVSTVDAVIVSEQLLKAQRQKFQSVLWLVECLGVKVFAERDWKRFAGNGSAEVQPVYQRVLRLSAAQDRTAANALTPTDESACLAELSHILDVSLR